MKKILVLFLLVSAPVMAQKTNIEATVTATSTGTETAVTEEPALPPDQIQIVDTLPDVPAWAKTVLQKFPFSLFLVSVYLAFLAFFGAVARALLAYSKTTESKSDDEWAAKLGQWCKTLAFPLAILGWGAPEKFKKPGNTEVK